MLHIIIQCPNQMNHLGNHRINLIWIIYHSYNYLYVDILRYYVGNTTYHCFLCFSHPIWLTIVHLDELNSTEKWNEFNWDANWIQLRPEMNSTAKRNGFNWEMNWIQLENEMNSIEMKWIQLKTTATCLLRCFSLIIASQ